MGGEKKKVTIVQHNGSWIVRAIFDRYSIHRAFETEDEARETARQMSSEQLSDELSGKGQSGARFRSAAGRGSPPSDSAN